MATYATETRVDTAIANSREGNKYLEFELGDEDFGIEILKVKEIIGLVPISPVPRTPDYVKGVINLRGMVIPVVDLRMKFSLPPSEPNDRNCIIVVEVQQGGQITLTGVLVDAVKEVAAIKGNDIEDPPELGETFDSAFIQGIAKKGAQVSVLLDINSVLGGEEIDLAATA